MPAIPDLRNKINQPLHRIDPPTNARPETLGIARLRRPEVGSAPISSSDPTPPRRAQIPERYIRLEPLALSAYDDNPVLNEHGAAQIPCGPESGRRLGHARPEPSCRREAAQKTSSETNCASFTFGHPQNDRSGQGADQVNDHPNCLCFDASG